MRKNLLLDSTYSEWLEYYKKDCDRECINGGKCPFKFGNRCLGDILDEDANSKQTLRDVIEDAGY